MSLLETKSRTIKIAPLVGELSERSESKALLGLRPRSACSKNMHFQNGFNPIWESCSEFRLVYPNLTFVELQVRTRKDAENKSYDDPVIGTIVMPFALLRQGYRHAYLEDLAGRKLTPACLFLHLSVIECSVKKDQNRR